MIEYTTPNIMKWSRLGSRKTLGDIMGDLAQNHPELMIMTADVTNSVGLEDFAAEYPNQFLNAGIAEMNMVGMASGMALEGYRTMVMSFAPFITMRCFEAVRSYVGYMNLPVILVGIASGLSMGVAGNTHYGLEDIALMRLIPNMTVLSPADCTETVKSIQGALNYPHPVYIRLTGQPGQPPVYKSDYSFSIGTAIVHGNGNDIVLLATGPMVYESIRAARILSKEGINSSVVDIHTIKPLDSELIESLSDCKLFVTVEEHFLYGGLGSVISDFLADKKISTPLLRIGIPDKFITAAAYGSLLREYGLNAQHIAKTIIAELKDNN